MTQDLFDEGYCSGIAAAAAQVIGAAHALTRKRAGSAEDLASSMRELGFRVNRSLVDAIWAALTILEAVEPGAAVETAPEEDPGGRYIYGIVRSWPSQIPALTGLGGARVYGISSGALTAIVHRCPPEPYSSDDRNQVESWLKAHASVLDVAAEHCGTPVPMTFNTILHADDTEVVKWLADNSTWLNSIVERLEGRMEYGIEVTLDDNTEGNQAVMDGASFLRREMSRRQDATRVRSKALELGREIVHRVSAVVSDVAHKSPKTEPGKVTAVSLVCLATPEQAESIGNILSEYADLPGVHIVYQGPWPPYNFV